jgi:maltose alpha-D-glucosyltransferase/alpha-amylase
MDDNSFLLSGDPLWYKDAIIYQLHVKSFYDSTNDGIGDFNGLTMKLDYLESLGINAIWLLPFYPSPLKDDGYDISDYFGVHPLYGTIKDFKNFLKEAHNKGIKVITELVLNHTSDQHEWFIKSRNSKAGSYWRNFYVWSNTTDKYKDARIIFKDFETSNWAWDPIAKAYYWHRFYSHQPDLNYDNPEVHSAIFKVIEYWFELGVDGMRLDAVPYLYEQEGTSCENLSQTFEFLKKLRNFVDSKFKNKMLLAEANQWPEDAARYFGKGDMCHMAFNFPLMPRMFMALRKEDRFPIIDIIEQTPPIPEMAQWAIFLRNHDELTLEMVTEEERDFMYRSYANDPSARINLGIRRRLAPLLQNSRRRIELMNILLFSLPGTPIVYYGDEIGMGDNHFLGDRNGVRTPMQWSADKNAGFSKVNPQKLYLPVIIDPEYNYETVNVENQERNTSSLIWWMRRVIAMRRRYKAFSRGSLEIVPSDNSNVLTFIRKYQDEIIFIAVNLSRFCQVANVDLKDFAGFTPYDIFSNNKFPRISEAPYVITLGFHDYFWLILKKEKTSDLFSKEYQIPQLKIKKKWTEYFNGSYDKLLENDILPAYLQQRTTAGCKYNKITDVKILDRIYIQKNSFICIILILNVSYVSGEPDIIILPISADSEEEVNRIVGNDKGLIMALLFGKETGIIYDCAYHPKFNYSLLNLLISKSKLNGEIGSISGQGTKMFKEICKNNSVITNKTIVIKAGQRKTTLNYDNKIMLKLFRRIEEGINPDIELHKYLSKNLSTAYLVAEYYGFLEYKTLDGTSMHLGLFTSYINNTGTAWNQAVDAAALFFEEILSHGRKDSFDDVKPADIFIKNINLNYNKIPSIESFIEKAKIIGKNTADLHLSFLLQKDKEFQPEPFSVFYQQSLFQSFRKMLKQCMMLIRSSQTTFLPSQQKELDFIISKEKEIISLYQNLLKKKISCIKIRIHGELHLGQFIAVNNKYILMDFEGNIDLPLSERRLKRSIFFDVCGVAYSFYRAAYYSLINKIRLPEKEISFLLNYAKIWAWVMCNAFWNTYYEKIKNCSLIPENQEDLNLMLKIYCLNQDLYELYCHLKSKKENIALPIKILIDHLNFL